MQIFTIHFYCMKCDDSWNTYLACTNLWLAVTFTFHDGHYKNVVGQCAKVCLTMIYQPPK